MLRQNHVKQAELLLRKINDADAVLVGAAAEPNCTYITFNKGELYIPAELMDKSIGVDGDIAEAISKIVAIKCT